MISIIDSGKLVNTDMSPMVPRSCEMVGLSTDTKPTGVSVGNGWSFIEMDTGKVFFYNAEDEEWLEFAGSGGGGGQGGSNVLVVNCDTSTYTLDKTWKEIHDAEFAVIRVEVSGGSTQFAYIDSVQHVESYSITAHVVAVNGTISLMAFLATAENGYPVAQMGD